MVQPLLRFRNLTHLNLSRHFLALKPGNTEAMARAWPHVRTLRLWTCSAGSVPCMPPEGRLHFARQCPKFYRLEIDLACMLKEIPTHTQLGRGPPLSRLRHLHLGRNSVIEDSSSAPLATFLSKVFSEACIARDLDSTMDGGELVPAAHIDEVQRMTKSSRDCSDAGEKLACR